MPTFVDYAGMNILISSSIEGNTISSGRNTEILSIPIEEELVGINLHRNGPYGYSSWKQLRVSENPVTRHHIANSTMTFVVEPGPIVPIGASLRVRDRYSVIYSYTEPAIAQKAFPLVWNVGRHFKDEDGQLAPQPQKFSIMSSYANQQIGFANEKVDKLLRYDVDEEQSEYVAISEMYLENGLNKQDSPLTYWEFLQYRETVYPHMKNQFQNENLERPTFDSFFRHNRSQRTRLIQTSSFGFTPKTTADALTYIPFKLSQSTWPLDEAHDFLTRTFSTTPFRNETSSVDYLEFIPPGGAYSFGLANYVARSGEGQLLTTTTQYWDDMRTFGISINSSSPVHVSGAQHAFDIVMAPGPLYTRRVSVPNVKSVSNPSGMLIDRTGSINGLTLKPFMGGALWEAGPKRHIKDADGNYISAPKTPFFDTYEHYIENARRRYKNFSVVPEFRISNQIEDYRTTNNAIELDMFDVTGGASGVINSSDDNFYEIYSNSDFMRNFEVIDDDHKDFTNGKVLSLRCKAVKKLLPYEGFYPAQRTVQLTERFYDSFKNNIKLYNANNVELNNFNFGRQIVMAPLFAPGVLFNTIKSGIAVDYPIITGSLSVTNYGIANVGLINDQFQKRIPFEALLEPASYLSQYKLTSNEPHASGNVSASAEWSGDGDDLYSMMANNFLAESINFFLPEGRLTSVVSKKQKDITLENGKVYGMRVKMRRSMNRARGSVFHFGTGSLPYLPPQDVSSGSFGLRETFTMYSRPSAFGPPSRGLSRGSALTASLVRYGPNAAVFHDFSIPDRTSFDLASSTHPITGDDYTLASYTSDSRNGFNYPFTPPYYHGEAWCHITFTASSNSMTIKEIQESSSYEYIRHDSSHISVHGKLSGSTVIELGSGINVSHFGPQSLRRLNANAVQLSASLNIKGIGRVKDAILRNQDQELLVDTALDETDRWVIQTKFETPMLNFSHVSGSDHITFPVYGDDSVPRGIWHQHGRITEENEGVFLEVNPIPENYQKVVMGKSDDDFLGDMANALGFAGSPTKIGRIASSKKISECVVAVPFIEKEGGKKFFRLALTEDQLQQFKEGDKQSLTTGPPQNQIGRSVLLQLEKMQRFVFPPSFDFLRFPDVDPIAMYVFEFSHTLSQQDLSDIWQNLPPDIGTTMEVSEVAITHPLLQKELLGQGGEEGNQTIEMPERLKWMVFKVKQRAATNYFKKTVLRNPEINTDVNDSNVTKDEFGDTSPIQYNWPYDFFSLVELVKIDSEVEMGNIDFSDYTDNMPAWDGVSADRDKIEQIVGGLEDDPIPEVQIPELMGQELAVSTQVFAGTDIEGQRMALGNNVVAGTTMAAGVGIDMTMENENEIEDEPFAIALQSYVSAKSFAIDKWRGYIDMEIENRNLLQYSSLTGGSRRRIAKRARRATQANGDVRSLKNKYPNLENYIDRLRREDY